MTRLLDDLNSPVLFEIADIMKEIIFAAKVCISYNHINKMRCHGLTPAGN